MKTAQIGKCGELLVQFKLLMHEVESAHLTTDAGVDLVAYSDDNKRPVTIQVKANLRPKPGGGKGKEALDWWIPENNPAHFVALVDLSTQSVWLFEQSEIADLAQQTSNGRHHLYMYVDLSAKSKKAERLVHKHEFEKYILENRVREVFYA